MAFGIPAAAILFKKAWSMANFEHEVGDGFGPRQRSFVAVAGRADGCSGNGCRGRYRRAELRDELLI